MVVLLAVRIAWFALPLTVGPALAHGLDGASTPVQVVASALAWLTWGMVTVAVLVPRTVSLTALRIGAPAALAASIWATVHSGDVGVAEVIAIGWTALLAAIVLFMPVVTDLFVDGSSYGPELRMALRTPATLFLGPVEIAWAVVVGGVAAGPLLLAARGWYRASSRSPQASCWFAPRCDRSISCRVAGWCSCGSASCCTTR